MSYWQWEDGREEIILKNVCGPSDSLEAIENRKDSIVWLADPQPSDVCLDLGCGIGRVEKHLAHLVREIHGVDFSAAMLARARQRLVGYTNVHFYQNDGETLSMFDGDMFDLVWAELVFHHVPIEITDKYLSEVDRVIKPGGRFICQLPLKDFYNLHRRDICGWVTCEEAARLLRTYFDRVEITTDGRHILALANGRQSQQRREPGRSQKEILRLYGCNI